VLHENFTLGMGAGFVLVLLGSILSTRKAPAREAAVTVGEARREEVLQPPVG